MTRPLDPATAPPPATGAPSKFVALDFETATGRRDSACAVGVVVVEDGRITHSVHRLIRPPKSWFSFTWLHGLDWKKVRNAPAFDAVWRDLAPLFDGADFVAAHNASFDRSVLAACCSRHGLATPPQPFVCSVKVAREVWDIRPTKLSDVCARLDIPLNHHEALSDATACARIVIAATATGWRPRLPGSAPPPPEA